MRLIYIHNEFIETCDLAMFSNDFQWNWYRFVLVCYPTGVEVCTFSLYKNQCIHKVYFDNRLLPFTYFDGNSFYFFILLSNCFIFTHYLLHEKVPIINSTLCFTSSKWLWWWMRYNFVCNFFLCFVYVIKYAKKHYVSLYLIWN